MMDLVASLEWVRDNIEKFGGDPAKVMIFGQSGGGAKTSTMLAMPSAQGPVPSRRDAERIDAAARHARAGTKSAELRCWRSSISPRATSPTSRKLRGSRSSKRRAPWARSGRFRTGGGGQRSAASSVRSVAPPESADVPVIISTTLEDAALAFDQFRSDAMRAEGDARTSASRARPTRCYAMYSNRYTGTSRRT